MVCPNCGKEVNDDNYYCNFCGNALYGPRNINLNNPKERKAPIQNNNIESITGIDINDIAKTVVTPPKKKRFSIKIFKNIPDIRITTSTIIFLSIILVLFALCFYFALENRTLRKDAQDIKLIKCNNKKEECHDFIYGLTENYTFKILNNWSYRESVDKTILTDENLFILVYPYEVGSLERIKPEDLTNIYQSEGYSDAKSTETLINNNKMIYIKFTAGGLNFADFYYQYDAERIIYGQLSSTQSDDLLTKEVTNIISSFVIQKRENISVKKAPVTYENIFKLVHN